MPYRRALEVIGKRQRRIVFQPQGADGIHKHGTHAVADIDAGYRNMAALVQAGHHMMRRDAAHRQTADGRVNITGKHLLDITQIACAHRAAFKLHPLPRHGLKSVPILRQPLRARLLPHMGRMNALPHQLARLVPRRAGGSQPRFRISTDGKHVFFAANPVTVTPQLRAVGLHKQIQPVAVGQFQRLIPGLGLPDFGVGEHEKSGYRTIDTRNNTRFLRG